MKVTKDFFDALPNFEEYHNNIKQLFEEGKTTGPNQSDAMINYTKLSLQRMKRGLKTVKLNQELVEVVSNTNNINWLVISEAWCGDAGNIIPVFDLLSQTNSDINLKVMLRDEYPEIMENYLTRGGKSIPILVAFDNEFNEVQHWGPRPKPAQDMVWKNKENPTLPYAEFAVELQKWYVKDKTQTLQEELTTYFDSLK